MDRAGTDSDGMGWVLLVGPCAVIEEIDATGPLGHLAILVAAGLALLIVAGAGARLLRGGRLGLAAADERFLFGLGLGLGAVSLAMLGLGLAGALSRWTGAALLAAAAAFGAGEAARLTAAGARAARDLVRTAPAADRIALLLALLAVLLGLALAGFPPADYDDLEYHLGAPKRYLEEGRIAAWPTMAYAAFPLNYEMWVLLGMVLSGSAWKGALFGKALNAFLVVAVTGAAGALGRRFLSPRAALWGAVFFLCCNETGLYALRDYVEPYLALESVLALHAFLAYATAAGGPGVVHAAVASGLALGCKYPAALFVAAPLGLGTLVAGLVRGDRPGAPSPTGGRGIAPAVLFACVTLAVASPWFARNLVDTGNPAFPLLGSVLGGAHWTPEQEARFHAAHSPHGSVLDCARGLLQAAQEFPFRLSVLLVAFLPLLGLARPWRPALRWLVAYAAAVILLWLSFTHRIDRFLFPLFPLLALLSAAGLEAGKRGQAALRGAALAVLAFYLGVGLAVGVAPPLLPAALGLEPASDAVRSVPGSTALLELETLVPADGRVLLVGEDRSFYATRPVIAVSVFDRNPLVAALDAGRARVELRDLLHGLGVTHVYVGWSEVERLDGTYAFVWQGRLHPGYWSLGSGPEARSAFLARTVGVLETMRRWEVWEVTEDGRVGWSGELFRVK